MGTATVLTTPLQLQHQPDQADTLPATHQILGVDLAASFVQGAMTRGIQARWYAHCWCG